MRVRAIPGRLAPSRQRTATSQVARPLELLEVRRLLASAAAATDILVRNPSDVPTPPAFDHPLSWYSPARTVTLNPGSVPGKGGDPRVDVAPGASVFSGSAFGDPVTFSTNAAGLPLLTSRTDGGGLKVFLDFDGYGADTPFDTDGNSSTFSASEQAIIYGAWRDIVSFFSMLNVNVTTVQPPTGGSNPVFVWQRLVGNLSGGAAYVGWLTNNSSQGYNNAGDAISRHSGIAHEIGHQLNLQHQSDYDSSGALVNSYSSGYDARHGPIMGVDYAQWVHKWFNGHIEPAPDLFQDDLAGMSSFIAARVGGDGYMPDDFTGASIAAATALPLTRGSFQTMGSIERMSDADYFSFTSTGETFNINLEPTFESGFVPKIELFDSGGNLVAAKSDAVYRAGSDNHSEEFTLYLSPGTYYAKVSSHGDYGDLGEYAFFASPLPSGWNTIDVRNGGTGRGGYATYDPSTGTFYNGGSGADIWTVTDAFRFTYQVLNGDGSITARVTSLVNTDPNAKAGVMIRESLSHNSRFAMICFKPSGSQYLYRTATGGFAAAGSASLAIPNWVQLSRAGNVITLRQSFDGDNWFIAGTVTLNSLASQVYIGLATVSHNVDQLATATFTNVSLTGVLGATPPIFNALPAPSGLAAANVAAASTAMTLTWADVAGETGYAIERSVDGVNWSQIGTAGANVTSYTHDPGFGSMRWWFRVTATDGTGKSQYSNVASVVNKPKAPTNQQVVSISSSKVSLSWRDVSGDTGYRIERSSDGGVIYTTVGTTATNINTFNSTGLSLGLSYSFRITPLSAMGDGVPLVFSAVTSLPTVGGFAFTSRLPTALSMSWADLTGESGYILERSVDQSNWTSLGTLPANTTSYTDATVSALNHYYYRIRGTTGSVLSVDYSTIFTATPPLAASGAPWLDADIGNPPGAGAGFITGGNATVIGAGANIADSSDQFNFLYQPMSGDGQIIAHVAAFDGINTLAKAGIMIRNTLAADSAFADVVYQPSSTDFMYRTSAAASSGDLSGPSGNATWLRLVRSGSTFSGYYSTSGIAGSWILLGSANIAMNTDVYVGLAVCPRDPLFMAAATFDNVAVLTGANPPGITNSSFDYEHGPNKLSFTFNQDVGAAFTAASLSVSSVPAGAGFSATAYSYNSQTQTGTFTLPPGLPNGNYRATFAAGGLLAADFTTDFFVLAGDANRDRVVDITDLAILATNWQGAGKTFSQGDFSYNGVVDISDLAILATNWQSSMPAPPPAIIASKLMPVRIARAAVGSLVLDKARVSASVLE